MSITSMMLLLGAAGDGHRTLEYVVVGGGAGGGVTTTGASYGSNGLGGQVVTNSFGDLVGAVSGTIVIGAGGAGAPYSTSGGTPGDGSSSSLTVSGSTVSAAGGTSSQYQISSVATFAGNVSGSTTGLRGAGGLGGHACTWAPLGFPEWCEIPNRVPAAGVAGVVVIREAITAPQFSSYTGASYSTSGGYHVYTWLSSGSFSF